MVMPYLNKARTILLCSDSLPFSWTVPFDWVAFRGYIKDIKRIVSSGGWFLRGMFLYPHKRVMIMKFKKDKGKVETIESQDPFTLERIKGQKLM